MTKTTLGDLTALVTRFRDEREWQQFHTPKDLAISLTLEAAELLELTQWRNDEELQAYLDQQKDRVAEELADVLYWVLLLAHDLGIDLTEAFQTKLVANAEKYPIEKARGSHRKYTEL